MDVQGRIEQQLKECGFFGAIDYRFLYQLMLTASELDSSAK